MLAMEMSVLPANAHAVWFVVGGFYMISLTRQMKPAALWDTVNAVSVNPAICGCDAVL